MAEPLRIVLEFARAQDAGDPHAFRFAPQTYLVRGRRGDFASAEVEWTRELLGDLEAVRLPSRDPAALARIGEVLRRILEPAGWREHEGSIVDAVADGRAVHITLRSAAAELYTLPWELLTLKSTGQSLGAIAAVLLRYEWPATASARARPQELPGRAVIAWSAAGGAVPAEGHVAALRAAAQAAGRSFDEAGDVLGRASYGRLADLLATAAASGPPIEVVHLLCHGAAQGSTFGLVLDGEASDDPPIVVDPGRVQQLLAPHAGMIRLVVIAACDGGNAGSPGNRLGSVAQMLHRVGIAAVVASRYPFSVAGSTRMSEALYRGLLGGATLEVAFGSARTALARDPTTLDWASAQLYARAEDGDATRPLTLEIAAATTDPATPTAETRAPALRPPIAGAEGGGGASRWLWLAGGLGLVVALVVVAFILKPGGGAETPATSAAATAAVTSADPSGATRGATIGATSGATSAATTSGGEVEASATSNLSSTTGPKEPDPKDTSGSTSATATKKTPVTPTKKTTIDKKTSGGDDPPKVDPNQTCERSLRDYLQSRMGAPAGGGVLRVKVRVDGSGAASLASCDSCGADEAGAKKALADKVDAATARDKGKGRVPCAASFDWQ